MKIIVADDDPISLQLLVRMLRQRTRHEVIAVSSGQAALELVSDGEVPDVLILDWEMPGLSGPEVCTQTRALDLSIQPYLLLVTVRNSRGDYVEGLEAGADELLSKPVPPELLLSRLGVALRRPKPGALENGVSVALRGASAEGEGELIIRDGEINAKLYFRLGQVGWVHLSDEESSLVDILAPVSSIDAETASAVVEECRVTSKPLSAVLEEWGLVERARLRDCLKGWFTRRLSLIRQFPQPETIFLPHPVEYADDLLFELAELGLPNPEPSPSKGPQSAPSPWQKAASPWHRAFIQPDTVPEQWTMILQECMASDGILSVTLVEQATGCCLGSSGVVPNPDIVWANVQNMTTMSRLEPVESCLVTTRQHLHLVYHLESNPGILAYAVFGRQSTTLAAALLALKAGLSANG